MFLSSLGSAGDPMPYGVRSMRIAYPIGLPTPEGRTIGPENPPFKAADCTAYKVALDDE